MKTLLRLVPYLKRHRLAILTSVVCLLLATPCQLFHPLVWMFVVNTVIGSKSTALLVEALLVMIAVNTLGNAIDAFRGYILGRAGRLFIYDLRNDIYAKLQRQSADYFHERRAGDIISRAMNDVETIEIILVRGVDTVLGNIVSFVCVAGIIVYLQWVVGLFTLLPMIVVGLLMLRFNSRVRGLFRAVRERMGDVTAKLHENLAAMPLIKAFAREDYEAGRFGVENRRHLDVGLESVKVRSIYFPSIRSVSFLSNIIMLGLGCWFIWKGQFTIGGLIAYRGYSWQLFSPMNSIADINEMWQRALASARRIFELLDEPESIVDAPGALALDSVKGSLAFEDVSFHFKPGTPTLSDVNFIVRPGETLGIVGPSGTGKSTILHLLLRFYDPVEGRVVLDGHDLRALAQHSARRRFALVSQDAFLFNESIRDNIRFGALDASNEQIGEAALQANAHDFIEKLPGGYDAIAGERGVKLSGGQRQRICIARAFIANPAVLLLDEATASVEPESEALIQAALARLMKGRTTVVVSHRLSMVRDLDRILVVLSGRVAERGTHPELMAHDGWYARMYRLQMGETSGSPDLESEPLAQPV